MTRAAVLIDEKDRALGSRLVHEGALAIRHKGRTFVKTAKYVRLAAGGVGIVFQEFEPIECRDLNPVVIRGEISQ